MQIAAYGTYRNGQIILDAPLDCADATRVVVSLPDKTEKSDPPVNWVDEFFAKNGKWDDEHAPETLGDIFAKNTKWDDKLTSDEIIAEIYNSRVNAPDIQL
jgi:hypothetical protein